VARLGTAITTDSLGQPLREGDRVAYSYFYPCGRCPVCLRGKMAACPRKVGRPQGPGQFPYFHGAFAEYYYLHPGGALFKVPEDLADEVVAPVNCALAQVIYGLSEAGLRFGESVVIQGAGGLGLHATAVAREMGASPVIVLDRMEARLDLARAFGADHTLNVAEVGESKARVRRVRELTGGLGAGLVCDFVGFPGVIPEGIEMLRPGGTYLEIGCISRGPTVDLDPSTLVWGSKRIVGVIMYDPGVIPQALAFLRKARGRYPFDAILSHRFPLDEINEAFRQAEWMNRQGEATLTRAALAP